MGRIEDVFDWCLKQGEKGDHKGLRKTDSDKEESERHIKKALHNLKAMDHNIRGGFKDWAVSAAFYAMYHSLLAVLSMFGYESRNQECTITAIEYFIKNKRINLDQKYIEIIRRTSEMMPKDAKMLREEFQYGTEIEIDGEILNQLKNNAKEFVEKVQILLEEIKLSKK